MYLSYADDITMCFLGSGFEFETQVTQKENEALCCERTSRFTDHFVPDTSDHRFSLFNILT